MRTAQTCLCALLVIPLLAAGCGGGGTEGDADAEAETTDIVEAEAPVDGRDAADGPGADGADAESDRPEVSTCISSYDCSNSIFCDGQEQCVDGRCMPAAEPPCRDEFDCTVETCDEETQQCRYQLDHAQCDNGMLCDGAERCSPLHGCVSGLVPDCADDDICTVDLCIEERGGCVHDQRDLDGDGHVDANCEGDDCNDRDAAINPDATEVCDDSRDNNCNMMTDMSDPACKPANDTCAGAILLAEGTTVTGSTIGTTHNYSSSRCYVYSQKDVVYKLDLAAERDLIVTAASTSGGTLYVSIQTTCGTASSELTCVSGSSVNIRRNHLPAGSYFVVVWTSAEGNFTINYSTAAPTPRPANDVCAGAVDVSAGGAFTGSTVDCLNDYSPSCVSGGNPDTFYRFTLAAPRKVTLTLSVTTGYPTLGLAFMTTCGDRATELGCANASSSRSVTLTRNYLAAGTYYLAADVSLESAYSLSVQLADPILPPANDRCEGAVDASAGGLFAGSLMESNRDYATSCGDAAYRDVAYRFTTTAAKDVTLELSPVGAADNMALAVVTSCADMRTELRCQKSNSASYVLRSLPAGTYYVIVAGNLHGTGTIKGRYLLSVAFGPPSPVPANDSCTGPVNISGGGTFSSTTTGAYDDYRTSCGPAGYYDVVFSLALAETRDVIVDVNPSVAGTVAVELQRACGSSTSPLDCTSSTLGELHAHSVPAGTYYLVVDTQAETAFSMTVSYGAPTSICDGATAINVDTRSGAFSWTTSGTTVGRTNTFDSTCGGSARSPDIAYRMNVANRSFITIADTAASFDTVLHVRSLCDSPSSGLYCDDDGGTCSLCSQIAQTFAPGTYYVIQDGFGTGSSGTFTLSVSASAAP